MVADWPGPNNARVIPPSLVEKVASSIRSFGWRQPIVVDTAGVIVVGHVRLLAAQSMALSEVPVHVARDLTPSQVKAYRLMDNRSHDEATWDLPTFLLTTEICNCYSEARGYNSSDFALANHPSVVDRTARGVSAQPPQAQTAQ